MALNGRDYIWIALALHLSPCILITATTALFTSFSLPDLSYLIPRIGKALVGNTISCGGGPFPPAKDWQIEAFRPKR
ncbi:hypothetical protein F5887DRAFT_984405 [Amanita rubescens]|nr:hypothetical protein F5887DRAFT_984405 [Amanita rubescens]